MLRIIMVEQQVSSPRWRQMIDQSFLSLYTLPMQKLTNSEYHQGYDYVFEFAESVIYVLVNSAVVQANQEDVDASQIRGWRKEAVNHIIKRHASLFSNEGQAESKPSSHKQIFFVGLTSLGLAHEDEQTYEVEYEYGSQFFAEDCVLDLDDEQNILQIFSYKNFNQILRQLFTPSDLAVFLQFHRSQLVDFQSFEDESTLLQAFFQSPAMHQKAIKVQKQLVKVKLMDKVEPRLVQAIKPDQAEYAKTLMAKIHKNTQMWYKLFNALIQRHYEAGAPLPKDQVKILVDESMYTYTCFIEQILAYRDIDRESRLNGYIRHQHSYSVFGRHYMMIFYAQNSSSSLSAANVRANYNDLLFELNNQLQQPVMDNLFIIGVDFRASDTSVDTQVHLDVFHQSGSTVNSDVKRLYAQLADLKLKSRS